MNPYRIEPHEWAASERAELRNLMADYLASLAGVVIMLGLAPLAVVMVLAGAIQ